MIFNYIGLAIYQTVNINFITLFAIFGTLKNILCVDDACSNLCSNPTCSNWNEQRPGPFGSN
jgi:hypothetical protein